MSSRYRVIITDYGWPSVELERQVLAEIGAELIVAETGAEDELVGLAPEADGILTNWKPTTGNVIQAASECKVIGRMGIGVDNIDVETATALGIVVTNVPDFCVDEVSDHAMALLLACARKVALLDRGVRDGEWDRDVGPSMHRMRGQTLGIIGLGKIGAAIPPKAKAFGLEVLAYTPRLTPQIAQKYGVECTSLQELIARSDFITIHAPLTPATEGLIGEKELRKMKPTAYIINTSRGDIIDSTALHKALTEGWIAGAALDVLPQEPPADDYPLLGLDNVVITPHAAFMSEESIYDLEIKAATAVAKVLTGQMPESIVNPKVLESPVLRAKQLR